MRSGWGVLLLVVLIPASMMQLALSADYTPSSLTTIVYSDGVVGVEYHVEAAPTAVRVSLPLFGSTYTDLLVVNQDGLPLVTTQAGSTITVDSLGASRLTITYSTQELTSKLGTLWTLNVTSPVNLDVLLPSGATIVSISQIPLRVETFSEHPSVTLPPGVDSVSYVVSAVGTNQRAQSAIQAAEAAITTAKASGLDTTAAEALLTQAKTAYNAGEYLKAEQLATQAKSSAQSASKTPTDNTPLIVGGAVVVVAAVAGILLYRRRRVEAPTPQPPAKKSEEGPVDLEAVFQKHPDLRVDDKEVIRFLSEHGGEAFANEIRDRFDIPRTSAWRMIRRLITTGIVEERKIGGQSLIYVVKKYRGAQV